MSNTAQSVLDIARGELGYSRWTDPERGTKYGRWYAALVGDGTYAANGVPFCAMFASWVFDRAGARCAGLPGPYCPTIVNKAKAAGKTVPVRSAQPGDVVLFDWDGGVSDHVGIVESNAVGSGQLTCIEGNTDGGQVKRRVRAYSTVCCVVRPDYGVEPTPEPQPKPTPKPTPRQVAGDAKNDLGMRYRMHCQKVGWLPSVHDGQTAGTVGFANRGEAFKITPPDGVKLDAGVHVQGMGDMFYSGIEKGKSSGTGTSHNDPIMGTVGSSRRLEAFMLHVTELPAHLKGKALRYQAHLQGRGWTPVCRDGEWCGTKGESRRLEAMRVWFE